MNEDLETRMLLTLSRVAMRNLLLPEQERITREENMMGQLIKKYSSKLAGRYFEHYASMSKRVETRLADYHDVGVEI